MKLHQKLVIGIVMASSLFSCVRHQDQKKLSTKSPVINKVQLSGYTITNYTAKQLSLSTDPSCGSNINPVISEWGSVSGAICRHYYNKFPYNFVQLFYIDVSNNMFFIEKDFNIKTFTSGFDRWRDYGYNFAYSANESSLQSYTYNMKNTTDVTPPISGVDLATSVDGNLGATFTYDENQHLVVNRFIPYNLSKLTKIITFTNFKTNYNYFIHKITFNRAILNISEKEDTQKGTTGARIIDLPSGYNYLIQTYNKMETLHFDVLYQGCYAFGISQISDQEPKFAVSMIYTDGSHIPTINYFKIPYASKDSIVKIVDSSSMVIYYTITDNGVTDGYFYLMDKKLSYKANKIIQVLTDGIMDYSKISTISLSQNDKFLLLNFKYDSVNPNTAPYITKIVFDDSFSNFIKNKIPFFNLKQ